MWLTDITEHPTGEGKLYGCAIKDVFSNRIVGYSIADRMTAELAVGALRSAVARRQPQGTVVVHSDRGGQFRSRKFRAVLKANDLTGSMGRVSSAGDNAAMESFYALLQKNVLDRHRWKPATNCAYAIVYWIEHTYNRRRRQRDLGKLTPVEYELAFTNPPRMRPDNTTTVNQSQSRPFFHDLTAGHGGCCPSSNRRAARAGSLARRSVAANGGRSGHEGLGPSTTNIPTCDKFLSTTKYQFEPSYPKGATQPKGGGIS